MTVIPSHNYGGHKLLFREVSPAKKLETLNITDTSSKSKEQLKVNLLQAKVKT
jgi:hypothetical protein